MPRPANSVMSCTLLTGGVAEIAKPQCRRISAAWSQRVSLRRAVCRLIANRDMPFARGGPAAANQGATLTGEREKVNKAALVSLCRPDPSYHSTNAA